jgi:hypothetical protein
MPRIYRRLLDCSLCLDRRLLYHATIIAVCLRAASDDVPRHG